MAPAIKCLSCSSRKVNNYTPHQIELQQILSLSLSIFSLCLGLLSVGWLLRVKRKFRHNLILLLLLSQTLKSLLLWIFPLAQLIEKARSGKPSSTIVQPSLGFCYTTGFFTAFGIEGADFIILMIAMHTLLTVTRPCTVTGESGLYPFRRYVYIGWLAFPTLLASLAFVNQDRAYVLSGGLCTLPIRPFWYRLALSWIPRYIILGFVTAVAIGIYVFVYISFKNTSLTLSDASDTQRISGLGDTTTKRASQIVPDTLHAIDWSLPSYVPTSPTRSSYSPTLTSPALSPPASDDEILSSSPFPQRSSYSPTLVSPTHPAHSLQPAPSPLKVRQHLIQKQLRYVFIYPVVYLLTWVIPFASHCFGYTDHFTPFALGTTALALLDLQCAVECAVFLAREKPWTLRRAAVGTDSTGSRAGSFCSSLWASAKRRSCSLTTTSQSTGQADWNAEKVASPGGISAGGKRGRRPTLHWWDLDPDTVSLEQARSQAREEDASSKGRVARILSIR